MGKAEEGGGRLRRRGEGGRRAEKDRRRGKAGEGPRGGKEGGGEGGGELRLSGERC